MKKIMMMGVCLTAFLQVSAQSQVDAVLESIKANNKTIAAGKQYLQAQNTLAKTGNTPKDPTVEYDILYGIPVGAGNQKDFSVTQQLDFPTAYSYRGKMANNRIEQNAFIRRVAEQDILLEAKKLCLEIIYQNKKQNELQNRARISEQLYNDVKKKFDLGDATILEFNRIKVQLVSIQNDLLLDKGKLAGLQSHLTELNGGQYIAIMDTIYPIAQTVPEFEIIDSLIEANDPLVKSYEKDKEVNEQRLALEKALALPKLETGYHSQSILGQSYRGIHMGISIPIWENRNKVKAQNQALNYSSLRLEEHRVEHLYENKEIHERYSSFKQAMEDTKGFLDNLNTVEMLNKALSFGQISSIEYAIELSQYYGLRDRLLELEKEYHVSVAELYKFQL